MSTTLLGLRTTIYKVGDITAATKWYAEAFATEPYFNEPFYVGFNIAGYELGLQPDDTPANSKTENVATYWGVNDIDAEFKRFLSLGATAFEEPENVGGEIMTATVKDLWGNLIGLIFNPEFSLPKKDA
ncbi:VOC family protein [Flavobacterium sp. Sd200]|uniref:VOC family protein n=1 Tax=Flavobacterium sp. Sd200 TaxID=2692211 RepID=UPI001926617D|nr:VOC family protein [Flavobacterium sp. Sd200]